MTKQVQRRRGTSSQHTSFTGAEGEISVNTTNKSIHVHDGLTAGGIEAARADLGNVSDANLNSALAGNTLSSLTITSADINGGTIDGATIGGVTAAAGSFTTVAASGNITVGGTVDGRDVAADGSKLDGIEALADVTDTANVTAAGALMDSELTNITAVKALNQGVATTDSPSFAGITATTADINGGTIDGTVIGGSTPAAVSGTTGSFSGNLTVDTNTLFVDAANNRVGVGTASPTASLDVARSGSHTVLIRTVSTGDPTLNLQADGQNSGQISYSRSGEALTFSNSGSERLRITSTGNVGIGTSSFAYPAAGRGLVEINGSSSALIALKVGDAAKSYWFSDGTDVEFLANGGALKFGSGLGGTERARIDASGNLLVGTTTAGASNSISTSIEASGVNNSRIFVNHSSSGSSNGSLFMGFGYGGNTIGSITQLSTTSVAYNTSSDYRLKEDVQPMVGASERVLSLKPCNFAWKADGTRVDGFLAHEAQAVVPAAVTGEKDGEEMQAIDHSKLVPLLTAALQDALKRIEALEAQLT